MEQELVALGLRTARPPGAGGEGRRGGFCRHVGRWLARSARPRCPPAPPPSAPPCFPSRGSSAVTFARMGPEPEPGACRAPGVLWAAVEPAAGADLSAFPVQERASMLRRAARGLRGRPGRSCPAVFFPRISITAWSPAGSLARSESGILQALSHLASRCPTWRRRRLPLSYGSQLTPQRLVACPPPSPESQEVRIIASRRHGGLRPTSASRARHDGHP